MPMVIGCGRIDRTQSANDPRIRSRSTKISAYFSRIRCLTPSAALPATSTVAVDDWRIFD
jgi:hypothetical protein